MDKKRKIKLILVLAAWIIVILLAAYVVTAYLRVRDRGINLKEYYGASFRSQDGTVKIEFNEDASCAYITTSEGREDYTVDYSYNIFTLSGTDQEDVHSYIIVDRDFIFGDNRYYICYRGG